MFFVFLFYCTQPSRFYRCCVRCECVCGRALKSTVGQACGGSYIHGRWCAVCVCTALCCTSFFFFFFRRIRNWTPFRQTSLEYFFRLQKKSIAELFRPPWCGVPLLSLSSAQGNNAYIFPGVGLAAVACGATRITDLDMYIAAKALAETIPQACCFVCSWYV